VIEYLRVRSGRGTAYVPPELAERVRAPTGEGAAAEPRPAVGAGEGSAG
jgi:hypothetical protein